MLMGDVLLTANGQAVPDTDSIQEVLRGNKPGAQIEIGLVRGGVASKLNVQIQARPATK